MMINDENERQNTSLDLKEAKFDIGQLVTHKLFNYRGVIVDIDAVFLGTDEWYEKVAKTRPPKNTPWYKVLVNNSLNETYVAERNLQADESMEGIVHPMVQDYFDEFQNGKYFNRSWQLN